MQNRAHKEGIIRRSPVMAGIFYPDTPSGVRSSLSRFYELSFSAELEKTLFIASTNLSAHYDDATAFEQGRRFLDLIQQGAGKEILNQTQQGHITACGGSGVAALLQCRFWDSPAAPCKPHLLGQASSRGLWEEEDQSVHYAALCIPF